MGNNKNSILCRNRYDLGIYMGEKMEDEIEELTLDERLNIENRIYYFQTTAIHNGDLYELFTDYIKLKEYKK